MHEDITVLISSSPVASHPSTLMIQETITSIRYHLPSSPIFIMLDGVRPEQEQHRDRYRSYILDLATICASSMRKVTLMPFAKFLHQAGMTMLALREIKSPLMLFVEHDTPLVDREINWPMLKSEILSGETNHIRLHYDERIHPEHAHMMCGRLTPNLIKTIQWHQRPHLANSAWYASVLSANFNDQSRTFIEDKVYSPVSSAPWEDYRLTVYDPEGTGQNMKRSRDLNGRGDESKYPMIF